MIDLRNEPKIQLESLYVGLMESLKPKHAKIFLGAYIENLEEYHEEMGGRRPTLQDAIDNMADNVHDMNDRDVLDLLEEVFDWLAEQSGV